jgi:hypothetical protein
VKLHNLLKIRAGHMAGRLRVCRSTLTAHSQERKSGAFSVNGPSNYGGMCLAVGNSEDNSVQKLAGYARIR